METPIIAGAVTEKSWNCLATPPEQERLLRFGNSSIWILRQESGWSLSAESTSDGTVPLDAISYSQAAKPEGKSWSRYFVDEKEDYLTAAFLLPDRPIAAQPKESILIPNGESARFTTLIPLSVKLSTTGNSRPLLTLPSMQLSKTLFGSPDTGEIVYASPLEVWHRSAETEIPAYCARCNLKVINVSGDVLDFSRICIRVEYLGLYLEEGVFVTDGIIFAFRGGEHGSSLSFNRRIGDSVEKIQPPGIPGYSKLIRKSFDFFRSLTTYS